MSEYTPEQIAEMRETVSEYDRQQALAAQAALDAVFQPVVGIVQSDGFNDTLSAVEAAYGDYPDEGDTAIIRQALNACRMSLANLRTIITLKAGHLLAAQTPPE